MKPDLFHLNLIEKFIVEHGSAKVRGVHIDFLREQLALSRRETTNLDSAITELKTANEAMRRHLQERTAETHRLEVAAEQQRTADRPDIQRRILLLLRSRDFSPRRRAD